MTSPGSDRLDEPAAHSRVGIPGGTDERPALFFSSTGELRRWFEANHSTASELWLGLNKKHVEPRGVVWAEAVEEALCFGWIDSVSQPLDEDGRRQRFTPRRPNSSWSKVNVALVEKLVEQGRMTRAGLEAFDRRPPEQRGGYSYEQGVEFSLPPGFEARLRADSSALAWFEAATPSYRRTVIQWVMSAKREVTRQKRMAELIDDCSHGRLIKLQRYGPEPRWAARARENLGLD